MVICAFVGAHPYGALGQRKPSPYKHLTCVTVSLYSTFLTFCSKSGTNSG